MTDQKYLWIREFHFDICVDVFGFGHIVADAPHHIDFEFGFSQIRIALNDVKAFRFDVEFRHGFATSMSQFHKVQVLLYRQRQIVETIFAGNVA